MGDRFSLTDEEFRKRYPALWKRHERKNASKPPPPPTRVEKAVVARKRNRSKVERHGCRWTEEEDHYLWKHWGVRSLEVMGRELGRSGRALYERARDLDLRIEREDMSLSAFAKYSGFDRSKVRNACTVLGLKLRRGTRARKWKKSASRKASGSSRTTNRLFVPIDIQEELLAFLLENAEKRIQVRRRTRSKPP